MCGRLSQARSPAAYAEAMGWKTDSPFTFPAEPAENFNAPPGARHWTMRVQDGKPAMEQVRWQYLSKWAAEKGMRPAINARLDKLLTPYYRGLMKTGRIIVPADGWYEWTGEKPNKRPWYIRPKNRQPLFLAALSNHDQERSDPDGAGFVIVTDEAAGGMVDVHDRRPVALNTDDAHLWMDAGTSYEQAEQIARTTALREDFFEWYEVSREVNKAGNNGRHLIEPL